MASDAGGVWRTVGGRRIFIKDGDDLQTAMKKSGKFKKAIKKNKKKWEEEIERDVELSRKSATFEERQKRKEEEESNPRDVVKYHLEKGEFEKAEKYMKEYGLEDEREEFKDSLNSKAQRDYENYSKSKKDGDLNSKEDKLENIKGGFWTKLEDLEDDIKDAGADVEEIDNENVTISYTDEDDDDYEIQATYELNTTYRDDKPSTITLGKRKRIERL